LSRDSKRSRTTPLLLLLLLLLKRQKASKQASMAAIKRVAGFGLEELATPPAWKKRTFYKKNIEPQIVRRWYLANNGYSLTVTLENKDVVLLISDHTSKKLSDAAPLFKMKSGEFLELMKDWKMIDDAAQNKIPGSLEIEVPGSSSSSSTDQEQQQQVLFVKLGNAQTSNGPSYGLTLYRKQGVEKQEVFLTPDSIQKITRAQKFIIDHVHNILNSEQALQIMREEIVKFMREMSKISDAQPVSSASPDVVEFLPATTTLIADLAQMICAMDWKKNIVANYDKRCNGTTTTKFNKYILFSYCLSQLSMLKEVWESFDNV
jgi:hypothetical protein